MKFFLTVLCFASLTLNSLAQGDFFLHQKVCDTSAVIIYTDIVQLKNGTCFVTGYSIDSGIYFNPFIIHYDANFQPILKRTYHGLQKKANQFLRINQLPNGNLLLLANLESRDGDFAGIDTNSLTPCGRIMVAEIDTLGNFIRTKIYAYCGQTIPTDMVVDKHNNIYISGHTTSIYFDFSANPEGGFETNAFLIRIDSNFNTAWLKVFDAPYSQDFEPHICLNNKQEVLFATGSPFKGGFFNATTPRSTGDLFIFCMDSLQNINWQKCYGSIVNGTGTGYVEAVSGVLQDSLTQDIYITGLCTSKDGEMFEPLDQNPFPKSYSSYVIKLDSAGNKKWSHRYGAFSATNSLGSDRPYATALPYGAVFKNNHLYLLSEVVYTDTNWIGIPVNNNQQQDQWLISIDTNGQIRNKKRFGGAHYERFGWLKSNILNNNLIFGVRSVLSECTLETTHSYNLYETGTWPTALEEVKAIDQNIRLEPNPTNESCTIVFNEVTTKKSQLLLYDTHGKRIKEIELKKGVLNYKLDTQNLRTGLYFIDIISGKEKVSLKLEKRE